MLGRRGNQNKENLHSHPDWMVSDLFCMPMLNVYILSLADFLVELVSALYNTSIPVRWKILGVLFKLPMGVLGAIEHQNVRDVQLCLVNMLATWLRRSVNPPPTWNTVIEAIQILGYKKLAYELTTKYLTGEVIVRLLFVHYLLFGLMNV